MFKEGDLINGYVKMNYVRRFFVFVFYQIGIRLSVYIYQNEAAVYILLAYPSPMKQKKRARGEWKVRASFLHEPKNPFFPKESENKLK